MLKFYAQIAEIGKDNILYACLFADGYYIYFVIDHIVMEGQFDSAGSFIHCPLYGGTPALWKEYESDSREFSDVKIIIPFNKTLGGTL